MLKQSIAIVGCLLASLVVPAQSITVNPDTQYQTIEGFGGVNMPSWIPNLTTEQLNTAFGNNNNQLGLTILRIKVPSNKNDFSKELAAARTASSLGAIVMASPWSPPASLKSNNHTTGGYLPDSNYGAYADHLVSFANYMEQNGVPLYAISVQNEPDIDVNYESCDWTAAAMTNFIAQQGHKFENVKLIAPESFHFRKSFSDTILNNAEAEPHVDIVGGHIYGSGLEKYPLAAEKSKAVWMTEHLDTDTTWTAVFATGKEINDCMLANYNAYLWWYIRRFYSFINDNSQVTKRGYVMAQFSKYIRPGYVRVGVTNQNVSGVGVTAYKTDTSVVVVVLNARNSAYEVTLAVPPQYTQLAQVTTSKTKNLAISTPVTVNNGQAQVTLDAQSITTFTTAIQNTVGINQNTAERSISVYPNPATNVLYAANLTGCGNWQVFNQMGQLVLSAQTVSETGIDIAPLPKGVYLVKIDHQNTFYHSKFVKL